ncbi:MAG TPA: hypothetical protein VF618_05400 [Thermoanaerobaculia bacterium]
MRKRLRLSILFSMLMLVLAMNVTAGCEWWDCQTGESGSATCYMHFGNTGGMLAVGCGVKCDCTSPDLCGCWCKYSQPCFEV